MISVLLLDYEPFWGTEKTLTKRRLDPCMLNMKSKINNMLQTDKRQMIRGIIKKKQSCNIQQSLTYRITP